MRPGATSTGRSARKIAASTLGSTATNRALAFRSPVPGLWGLWAVVGRWLGAFGRWRPPERRRDRRIELNKGRAQRVDVRGEGKLVVLDGAPDERRYRGVFGVGEVDRRHVQVTG